MLARLSLVAALVALASAAPTDSSSTTTAASTAPTAAPLLPLPDFSGTFANEYPTQDVVAPTDTPLVKQWLSELNLTDVASLPLVPFTSGGDPQNPKAIPADACDWTETNCINKDLTVCPLGVWGLTYDDGPTTFSSQLYDFLDKTEQKATLFYIGSNVIENWQSARRACAAGHHIAVHTWSHNPSTSLTNEQFVAEIKYTELAIKELCGFTPKYFRPPYGDIDNRIRGLLWAMGYTSVIWDYDTDDWELPPGGGPMTPEGVDQEFKTWISNAHNDTTGHITLQHELYQNTVDAAIRNLPQVQATWKAMPVSACMNDATPYRETNITLATMDGTATTRVITDSSTTTTSNDTLHGSTPSGASSTGTNAASTGGKAGSSSGSITMPAGFLNPLAVLATAAAFAFGGQMLF
ncbi:hypothetical protein BC939DRAFT_487660 [Gamsiella multidivaricata]|uniref:uncharacterized protein n=1 Tax=Gamsiella multidivaricata TaxID=101098 RepID=UPI00221F61CC|nr:uncharacterized protein BC939DRAFT_487660 [Gamsiella multidivaricata]KAG0359887.1 chitin deacetylase [Gamsiella multidivaricata]KAI7819302.1 hypothetical protein BC939DRAFT_487660 [Gamsiella multidivaricata]